MNEKIIVYGLGQFFLENKNIILNKYDVVGYVDKSFVEDIDGKKVLAPDQLNELNKYKILIMIQNIKTVFEVSKELVCQYEISAERLLYGVCEFDVKNKSLEKIRCINDSFGLKFIVTINGIECEVGSIDEYNNVLEVLFEENYNYSIANDKKDVILDVGMNVGSASLYFLNKKRNVEKIYAFEPFESTYKCAVRNIQNYSYNKEKIKTYNYGLSDVNERRTISFNPNATCGLSSIESNTKKVENQYVEWGIAKSEESENVEIEVRKASEVIGEIANMWIDHNIILKIDCEGEEYCIFDDLDKSRVINNIHMIMLEWHYKGAERLINILKRNGFSFWVFNKSSEMGLIYAVKQ